MKERIKGWLSGDPLRADRLPFASYNILSIWKMGGNRNNAAYYTLHRLLQDFHGRSLLDRCPGGLCCWFGLGGNILPGH